MADDDELPQIFQNGCLNHGYYGLAVHFLEEKNIPFNTGYITIDWENLFFSSFGSNENQKQ